MSSSRLHVFEAYQLRVPFFFFRYGAHLSKWQVAKLVTAWLEYNGVPPSTISTATHGSGWLDVCRRSSPYRKPTKLLGASCQLYDQAGRERVAHIHTRSLFHRIWPSRPPAFCRRRHVVDPVVQQKRHQRTPRSKHHTIWCSVRYTRRAPTLPSLPSFNAIGGCGIRTIS